MARVLQNQITGINITKPDDPSFVTVSRRFSNTSNDATDEDMLAFAQAILTFYPGAQVTVTLNPTYLIQA